MKQEKRSQHDRERDALFAPVQREEFAIGGGRDPVDFRFSKLFRCEKAHERHGDEVEAEFAYSKDDYASIEMVTKIQAAAHEDGKAYESRDVGEVAQERCELY